MVSVASPPPSTPSPICRILRILRFALQTLPTLATGALNTHSSAGIPRCTCAPPVGPQHPPFFLSPASRSAGRPPPDRRKEPSRAKLVRLASKAAVTPHSVAASSPGRRRTRSPQHGSASHPAGEVAWLEMLPGHERRRDVRPLQVGCLQQGDSLKAAAHGSL